ncbi:M35 family metallopeptidase [Devosia sp. A8/3-2]|nr:M35 family metallopeptidase [Devosia sp. A8/3-2]
MLMRLLAVLVVAIFAVPVQAQQADLLDRAIADAIGTFELALPQLGATMMGVDTSAYGDALKARRFHSARTGSAQDVIFVIEDSAKGSCAKFAAYVAGVANSEAAHMFLCPQFFMPGADLLRETTILHEMVHVVTGTDECQAMAYTAQVQMLARGSYVPVAMYWKENGCAGSRYALPE